MSDDKVISIGSKKTNKTNKNKIENENNYNEPDEKAEEVYCSFCGRPNSQVIKMVQGPGVNICSECTIIAVQSLILSDRLMSSDVQRLLDAFWRK